MGTERRSVRSRVDATRAWFLPQGPDHLGLLQAQAAVTVSGVDAFAAWSTGDLEQAQALRDADHEANRLRRDLVAALGEPPSCPVEPDDVYELSRRLDALLGAARDTIREAELLETKPDPPFARMAAQLADAVRSLAVACEHLASDPGRAASAALTAMRCEEELERSYCSAMMSMLAADDLVEIVGRQELNRRCAELGEGVIRIAERVRYAVAARSNS